MELAATMQRPVALSLSLVSNDVHAWIAPIIYRTVALRTEKQLFSFQHVSRTNLALVKSLTLDDVHADILKKCNNVSRLFVARSYRREPWYDVMRSTWSGAKPREIHLIIPLPVAFFSASPPCFANLTHIEIVSRNLNKVLLCPLIQRLTHLGIWYTGSIREDQAPLIIQRILDGNPALDLLVLYLNNDEREKLAQIKDERLLVGNMGGPKLRVMLCQGITTIWDYVKIRFKAWRDPTYE